MKAKKFCSIIGLIILLLILIAVGYLGYAGMFAKIEITEQKMGPYTLVYAEHIGPYTGVKPTMDKVYEDLKAAGIETTVGAGLYFDNPDDVPAEELRSQVGSLINKEDMPSFNKVKKQFKVMQIPAQNSAVVEFPTKTMASYFIGPIRVYPVLQKYWEEKSYSESEYSIEIYDMPNKVSTYIMPIKN